MLNCIHKNNTKMVEYLYLLRKKYAKDSPVYDFNKTCKIGSTQNFIKRMSSYKTPEAYFNNDTFDMYCFEIIKSKWNCYELDKIVQYTSIKYKIPYDKLTLNDGGDEHYKYNNNPEKLYHFLQFIGVECKMIQIDITTLRNEMSKILKKDSVQQLLIDYTEIDTVMSNDIYNEIDNKIGFKLKDYQITMRKIIAETKQKERLFRLIISPTGTGKTIVFTIASIDV